MKLHFQTRWVRLVLEFFPELRAINRYRAAAPREEARMGRCLRREISRQLRRPPVEGL